MSIMPNDLVFISIMPFLGGILGIAVVLAGGLPRAAGSGLFAGAFTCTPGLGAAQDSLRRMLVGSPDHGGAAVAMAGVMYAITYPIGLLGPTLTIAMLRRLLRIPMEDEFASLTARERIERPPIEWIDVEVTEAAQAGTPIGSHALLRAEEIRITRMLRDGPVSIPGPHPCSRLGTGSVRSGPCWRIRNWSKPWGDLPW
jgi:putative transport protein